MASEPAVRKVGRARGSVDAWTTRNFDPRGRFISTPFEERDWPAFKAGYERGFERTTKVLRDNRMGGAR